LAPLCGDGCSKCAVQAVAALRFWSSEDSEELPCRSGLAENPPTDIEPAKVKWVGLVAALTATEQSSNHTTLRGLSLHAYDAYEHRLTAVWRHFARNEGAVPDTPRTSDSDAIPVPDIETAYRLYAEEISQAWKTPR
jgi:hypothetical protein